MLHHEAISPAGLQPTSSAAEATDGTYVGTLSGSGSVAKSGAGTVSLTGTNTYSGGTTVTGGLTGWTWHAAAPAS